MRHPDVAAHTSSSPPRGRPTAWPGLGGWRRGPVPGLVVLMVLGAAGCGASGGGDTLRTQISAAAGVSAPPLPSWVTTPTLQSCPAEASTGRAELPRVMLRCLGRGRALAVDRLPARPYIVNLWASWCVPCQREAPRLAAAAAAHDRVGFLGIDTQDERGSALDFLHHFGIDYPQLVDPNGDVLHRLPALGIPVTLAVDASGRVVYRRIGELSGAQLAAALRAADPTGSAPAGGGR